MDEKFAMNQMLNSSTACSDCMNRNSDDKMAGFCKVYRTTPKPACVFKGVACSYYKKQEEGE